MVYYTPQHHALGVSRRPDAIQNAPQPPQHRLLHHNPPYDTSTRNDKGGPFRQPQQEPTTPLTRHSWGKTLFATTTTTTTTTDFMLKGVKLRKHASDPPRRNSQNAAARPEKGRHREWTAKPGGSISGAHTATHSVDGRRKVLLRVTFKTIHSQSNILYYNRTCSHLATGEESIFGCTGKERGRCITSSIPPSN